MKGKVRPPEATCCVCLTRKQCVTKRETESGIRYYDNFVYSEEHRGWLCKTCFRRIEKPKKMKGIEADQLEMFERPPPTFEEIWQNFPKRNGKRLGKQAARRLFEKVEKGERKDLFKAVLNYSRSERVRSGYARDMDRFLKSDWWREWLDGPGETDERGALVEELRGFAGSRYGSSVVISSGLSGVHADTRWEDMSVEELSRMLKRLKEDKEWNEN